MVESPFFLFPVRRRKSIFNLVCKSSLNSSLFYFYPDYDEDSEHNEPVFGLTYFDEFKLAKSLVLARGVIVNNFLSKTEADILLTAFMAHYCDSDLYEKYTKVFNLKKEEFDHEGFLENYFKKFVPIL